MGNDLDLEKTLINKKAVWIVRLEYQPICSKLYLDLTEDPETGKISKQVIFKGITHCITDYFGDTEEGNYMPTIIGIVDSRSGVMFECLITTESFELSFNFSQAPEVKN